MTLDLDHNKMQPQGSISPKTKILLQPLNVPLSKQERKMLMEQLNLREQLPLMTRKETANFWKTSKHLMCVELLSQGFHQSFDEIFNLIQKQKKLNTENLETANQTLLEDEMEKVEIIKTHLTEAEAATRKEDYRKAYDARLWLANYFTCKDDKWLSDHFHQTCLEVSRLVRTDGGKTYAEGFCNIALSLKDSGEYFKAMENMEKYYHLTTDKDWVSNNNVNLNTQATLHLCDIYTIIANSMEKIQRFDSSLQYLLKAHEKAVESKDNKIIGEAVYKLGLAYLKAEEPDIALPRLKEFLDVTERYEDIEGMGRAAEAIARAYQLKGNTEACINYLKFAVDNAEKSGQQKAYSNACHHLGCIYNSLCMHSHAVEYFNKAYNISRALNDTSSLNANRVHFGISLAHKMNEAYICHLYAPILKPDNSLLKWKCFRTEEFAVEEFSKTALFGSRNTEEPN
ncbi:tetratricopeptide repeat protein 29-like [Octopus sinensis]|uniref:Tetratricopeptide repeat protein 29 n=1 Tax=Octopus sinensis TaxID=2607531 RepID=A0A7E6EUV5_9MOLL|nr:tetratricopeptide repeat protein 29-like [Octopus sinensis]XP_036358544.1 tetratricopeptide repeat protein 29-like [Octopus sinensis]XP_036358545.1 tetratricopeptide repeat protein 29-like [Octopus sinensis]XP_036358547.1 tetratricopeptide repeat protein 29-like [Octopus sinensis]XP_036358550.1 tetratricopeptide repeat protein 29-like [Octopus sinensis]